MFFVSPPVLRTMPQITIPAALTGGSSSENVMVSGKTVKDVFDTHAAEYGPELRDSVFENNEIREYINVYVNGEEISNLEGLSTAVQDDDQIRVIPAASGG